MNIRSDNGTVRAEYGGTSYAWALYMSTPSEVTDTLVTSVVDKLKVANAGVTAVNMELCECSVSVDGVKISPTTIPAHAQAAIDVIYDFDDGRYEEIYDLRQLNDPSQADIDRLTELEARD